MVQDSKLQSASEEVKPTHRRMRSLLRNYYGIGDQEQQQQVVDPLSLDSTGFDKEKFVQRELKTKKLDALRSTHSKLKKGSKIK